ncbi:hypothetical protein BDW72DRAFT_164501 [Aspergillus terricola var. indicus]
MGIQRCRFAGRLRFVGAPSTTGNSPVSIANRIRLLMLLSLTARFASTMAMVLAQFQIKTSSLSNRSLSRRKCAIYQRLHRFRPDLLSFWFSVPDTLRLGPA